MQFIDLATATTKGWAVRPDVDDPDILIVSGPDIILTSNYYPGVSAVPSGMTITFPEKLVLECSLFIDGDIVEKLPEYMEVKGRLVLENAPRLTQLPDTLKVGTLSMRKRVGVTTLPRNLYTDFGLELLSGSGISSIPDNFSAPELAICN